MSTTTDTNLGHAAEQAQGWVNELANGLGWDERRAQRLLRAVLQALRDVLSDDEAADFSAQLPVLIRGLFFENWEPSSDWHASRKKKHFFIHVENIFGFEEGVDLETAVVATFALLQRHISRGEIHQVKSAMKKSLRRLWPTPGVAHGAGLQ